MIPDPRCADGWGGSDDSGGGGGRKCDGVGTIVYEVVDAGVSMANPGFRTSPVGPTPMVV